MLIQPTPATLRNSTPVNLASPSYIINAADAAAAITVSESGYKATRDSSAAGYKNVRGTISRNTGIAMASFWIDPASPFWDRTESFVGFATASQSLTAFIGDGSLESIGIAPTGKIQFNGGTLATIVGYSIGDQVDCAFHFAGKTFFSRVNGGWWNNSATADPATNTGGKDASTLNSFTLFPIIGLYSPSTICWSKLPSYVAPTPPSGVTYPWS